MDKDGIWQAMPSLSDKLAHAFKSEVLSDVELVLGSGQSEERLKCHKLILALHSPVFETMFSDRWDFDKGNEKSLPEFYLKDVNPKVFRKILNFMYTGVLVEELDEEELLEIFDCGVMYLILNLIDTCGQLIISKLLNEGNALKLLCRCDALSQFELSNKILQFICRKAVAIINQEAFLEITPRALSSILEKQDFVVSEPELFHRVHRWAKEECTRLHLEGTPENLRFVLGDSLRLIRFPAIPSEIFATVVVPTALLSLEETMEVVTFYSMSEEARVKVGKLTYFKTHPRSNGFTLRRFTKIGDQSFDFRVNWRNLCFEVDRPIRIFRLGFYGQFEGVNSEMGVTVNIMNEDRTVVFGSLSRNVTIVQPKSIFYVDFSSPIDISECTIYTISFMIYGPKTCVGDEVQDKMTLACDDSGTATFTFSSAKIKNNRFQIPEICFTLLPQPSQVLPGSSE